MIHSSSFSSRRNKRVHKDISKPLSEINVTPMVDVMLVLLIIFMVAAPLLTVGVPVELPKTKAQAMTDQKEPLIITIKKDGSIFIQESSTRKKSIVQKLKAVTKHNPDVKIYVRADTGIAYGQVMEVMGMLSSHGFSKFAFITEMADK